MCASGGRLRRTFFSPASPQLPVPEHAQLPPHLETRMAMVAALAHDKTLPPQLRQPLLGIMVLATAIASLALVSARGNRFHLGKFDKKLQEILDEIKASSTSFDRKQEQTMRRLGALLHRVTDELHSMQAQSKTDVAKQLQHMEDHNKKVKDTHQRHLQQIQDRRQKDVDTVEEHLQQIQDRRQRLEDTVEQRLQQIEDQR
jgi:DNA anti-recombination protein RmuC